MGIVQVPEDVASLLNNSVEDLLESNAWQVYCPDGEEEKEAYENLKRGKCMLCGNVLREHTVAVVYPLGIVAVLCDGECLTDMHTFGWLQEVESAMLTKVERKAASSDGEDEDGDEVEPEWEEE